MYGVGLAVRVDGDVVGVGGVVGEGGCEPLELLLVGVEGGPAGLDGGGDHSCSELLYRRGYRCG